jgi:predicted ATP-dependent serine protease
MKTKKELSSNASSRKESSSGATKSWVHRNKVEIEKELLNSSRNGGMENPDREMEKPDLMESVTIKNM